MNMFILFCDDVKLVIYLKLVQIMHSLVQFGFSLLHCNHCTSYPVQDPVNHSNSTSGSSTFPTIPSMSAVLVLPSLWSMAMLNSLHLKDAEESNQQFLSLSLKLDELQKQLLEPATSEEVVCETSEEHNQA